MMNILSEIRKIRNFFIRDEFLASRINDIVNPTFKDMVNNIQPIFTHFDRVNDFLSTSSGTGSSVAVNPDNYGIAELTTGTTTTGRAGVITKFANTGVRVFKPATLGFYFAALVYNVPVLPDATEDFVCPIGCINIESSNNPAGIYFEIDRTVSTTNWCVKIKGATAATIDTGVPISTVAGVLQVLEIRVNSDWTRAEFFINGISVYTETNSSRLIDASSSYMFGANLCKKAGTTSRTVLLDALMVVPELRTNIL